MMTLLFAIHIAGTVATVGYVVAAAVVLLRRLGSADVMGKIAASTASVQIVSGVGLAILSPSVSIPAVCARGLLLIGFLGVLHKLVSWRLAEQPSSVDSR